MNHYCWLSPSNYQPIINQPWTPLSLKLLYQLHYCIKFKLLLRLNCPFVTRSWSLKSQQCPDRLLPGQGKDLVSYNIKLVLYKTHQAHHDFEKNELVMTCWGTWAFLGQMSRSTRVSGTVFSIIFDQNENWKISFLPLNHQSMDDDR